ncbi:MAG: M20/M25/M40 family metallo-hydrolase [Candidatus Melainabacteria bacterium]
MANQRVWVSLLLTGMLVSAGVQSAASADAVAVEPTRTEAILKTFLDLVKLDSPSGKEGPVSDYLEKRLQALGVVKASPATVTRPVYTVDAHGNLILRIPGSSPAGTVLLLDAHMDAVPPCIGVKPRVNTDPTIPGAEQRVVTSSGDTVLGADDKAALAPMLHAVADWVKSDAPHPDLIILWTVEEELGGIGAGKLAPESFLFNGRRADVALSFDISGDQGTVVTRAPQMTLWDATITGRTAHAGIEPEKGVNALKAAVLAAGQVPVGRLDPETTANIGRFESGTKFNIVPGEATFSGEVRSFRKERVSETIGEIEAALKAGTAQVPGTSYVFNHHDLFGAYHSDLEAPVFAPLKSALADRQLPLKPIATNGGSDANVFAERGIPTVVLSAGFINPHQTSESVRVHDIVTMYCLMRAIGAAYATPRVSLVWPQDIP